MSKQYYVNVSKCQSSHYKQNFLYFFRIQTKYTLSSVMYDQNRSRNKKRKKKETYLASLPSLMKICIKALNDLKWNFLKFQGTFRAAFPEKVVFD